MQTAVLSFWLTCMQSFLGRNVDDYDNQYDKVRMLDVERVCGEAL